MADRKVSRSSVASVQSANSRNIASVVKKTAAAVKGVAQDTASKGSSVTKKTASEVSYVTKRTASAVSSVTKGTASAVSSVTKLPLRTSRPPHRGHRASSDHQDPSGSNRRRARTRTTSAAANSLDAWKPPKLLEDPLGDRAVQSVPRPAAGLFSQACLFGQAGGDFCSGPVKLELEALRKHLHAEGLLTQELVLELIANAKEKFMAEPNLLKLDDPITIVGDIHGQYYDLATIFDLGAGLGDSQFLFMGDYVDRGSFSMEVVIYLFALKISEPKRIWMLRGNHESRQMTTHFNFCQECEYKYDSTVYIAIMDCFDALPLAAVVNGQFLTVHGGLSPYCSTLKDIERVDRNMEPPEDGLFCDLLWSDPAPAAKAPKEWVKNTNRHCSFWFSASATQRFLRQNDLLCIVRGHEVQIHGFKVHETNPRTGFPSCITVFSAPNYCDTYGNQGAILQLNNSMLNVLQYNFVEHPFFLPNFMCVFEWSAPYLAEKVVAIFEAFLSQATDASKIDVPGPAATKAAGGAERKRTSLNAEQNKVLEMIAQLHAMNIPVDTSDTKDDAEEDSKQRFRQKAMVLSRMARCFKEQREANELLMNVRACPGDGMSHRDILEEQKRSRVKSEVDLFRMSRKLDLENEMRPRASSSPPPMTSPPSSPKGSSVGIHEEPASKAENEEDDSEAEPERAAA